MRTREAPPREGNAGQGRSPRTLSWTLRLVCVAYWTWLTALLLVPEPARLLGIAKASVPAINRGVHFSSFLMLAMLAWASRWPTGRRRLVLVLVGYAFLTEGLQWFVPLRHVDPLDLMENLAGLLAGTLLWLALTRKAPAKQSAERLGDLPTVTAPDSSSGSS
jgi:hypothetical protein